jgi:hypothetical protein
MEKWMGYKLCEFLSYDFVENFFSFHKYLLSYVWDSAEMYIEVFV